MPGHHQYALRVWDGLDVYDRGSPAHAAEQSGKSRVGRIVAGAKAHKAYRDGHARRVEDVLAVAQILMRRLGGMDDENEIAAGWVNFAIQFDREAESEHWTLSVDWRRQHACRLSGR
jgi:hypothetical protein